MLATRLPTRKEVTRVAAVISSLHACRAKHILRNANGLFSLAAEQILSHIALGGMTLRFFIDQPQIGAAIDAVSLVAAAWCVLIMMTRFARYIRSERQRGR